jgi:hypothetical protein
MPVRHLAVVKIQYMQHTAILHPIRPFTVYDAVLPWNPVVSALSDAEGALV